MRFQWNAFLAALQIQLRSWKTWFFVLLLPGLIGGLLAFLPQQERSAPVQVGVSLPSYGGEGFWTLLEEHSGVVVTFLPADEDTIVGKVASGQWDCGLLLPEDFQERLEALETDRLVTFYVGEGSTVYPLVREAVAAAVVQLVSPGMARAYLLDSGIADEDTITDMEPRLEEVLPDSDHVGIAMRTQDGRELDAVTLADRTYGSLFHGLIAIVLLIWTLFSAMDMGRWLQMPSTRRLRAIRPVTGLLLPRAGAAAVPVLCSAVIGIRMLPEGEGNLWALMAYLAALSGLSLVAARAEWIWRSFPVLAPLIPILCLLTSPILLDFSALFPAISGVARWTPVTLYLRACEGTWGDGLLLLGCGIAAVLLSTGLDRGKRS